MPGFSFFHHKDSQEVDSANTFTVDEESLDSTSSVISEEDSSADDPDYVCDGHELPELDEVGDNLSDDFHSSSTEPNEVLDESNNLMSGDNETNDIANDPAVSLFYFCLHIHFV